MLGHANCPGQVIRPSVNENSSLQKKWIILDQNFFFIVALNCFVYQAADFFISARHSEWTDKTVLLLVHK